MSERGLSLPSDFTDEKLCVGEGSVGDLRLKDAMEASVVATSTS